MSLGFARDSVHDLSSLVEKSSKSQSFSSPSVVVGESSEISLEINQDTRAARFDLGPNANETKLAESNSVKSKPTASTSYGHYSGFTTDYSEYEQYGTTYDHYSHSSLDLRHSNQAAQGGWWCCLLPWMPQPKQLEQEPTYDDEKEEILTGNSYGSDVESLRSEDEVSTGSAAYGEKLTDNERAAVVARLRLASLEAPDQSMSMSQETSDMKKGILHRVPCSDSFGGDSDCNGDTMKLKSILRKPSNYANRSDSSFSKPNLSKSEKGQRRSLFPQQYEQKPKKHQNIRFAPMARVTTVKSRNEMNDMEKSQIWWCRQDYEDFKKTGRIIAKAMCEGGSEVWLARNNAWENKASRINGTTPRAIHSSDRNEIVKSNDGTTKNQTNHDKWWHHFGHSRRGLEHIASVEEGRQRQANVRTAIRVVIDEQKRQKNYRKEDPEKLRMLSLQYTTWARELALAAAASDAEAVEVDFSENRKSREFYILKQAKAQGGFAKTLPSFMMPHAVSPQVLDHHTSTQIRIRRKQARVSPSPLFSHKLDESPTSSTEPIHDPTLGGSKLAKQAAGFGAGKTDVSAILSGLGSTSSDDTPNNSMTPLKPQRTSVGAH